MNIKINGRDLPKKTLHSVSLTLGGTALVKGEAVDENDRLAVDELLNSLSEDEAVEIEAEDADFHTLHGAGFIRNIKKEENDVTDKLRRLRYSFALQYAH